MKWWFVVLTVGSLFNANAEERSRDLVRAVERAMPFIEKEGAWWIEDKACVSCHHSTFLTWAKDLAVEAGIEVDPVKLDQQRTWVWESMMNPVQAKEGQKVKEGELNGDRNVEGVSQLLVSASRRHVPDEVLKSLQEIIERNQNEEEQWKPGGQLPRQKRSAAETQWTSNQWAVAALRSDGPAEIETVTGSQEIAAKTSEWYAMNVVLDSSDEAMEILLARQNDDGGWSWIDGEGSDPTGTGQALFAISRAGMLDQRSDAVTRAQNFLLATQAKDGRWKTMSTMDRKKSSRISDFWGSAWAVIGLLESKSD
tara:strand:- start:670 stop:1602 length:933 start_codon:yes stop_codon:yes gene_type:complete